MNISIMEMIINHVLYYCILFINIYLHWFVILQCDFIHYYYIYLYIYLYLYLCLYIYLYLYITKYTLNIIILMHKPIPILTLALTITILLHQVQSCFITHFVYYGNLSYIDYTRVSAFPYPYIMHLNQDIRFPNNYTLIKTLTPVEKSDIKKMQVIYHHGGLYIDNDHLIDMSCIRNIFCPLPQGLYVMDWTDRLGDVWRKSVPISFIYSNTAKNKTI